MARLHSEVAVVSRTGVDWRALGTAACQYACSPLRSSRQSVLDGSRGECQVPMVWVCMGNRSITPRPYEECFSHTFAVFVA